MAGDDFAELLRELKERSGLSFGTLGKRLHMSASTLHRYVSGEVVPVEFAPVERLARVCRATPEELLELHRRWIRADALRGVKKAEEKAAGKAEEKAEEKAAGKAEEKAGEKAAGKAEERAGEGEAGAQEVAVAGAAAEVAGADEGAKAAENAGDAGDAEESGSPASSASPAPGARPAPDGPSASAASLASAAPGAPSASSAPSASDAPSVSLAPPARGTSSTPPGPPAPSRPRRRVPRAALYAATGVVAIAGAVALVGNLVPGDGGDDGRRGPAGVAEAAVSPSASVSGTATRSASPSASASASASTSPSLPPSVSPSASATRQSTAVPSRRAPASGPALTVATTPYYWDVPCDHAFLVDRSPKNVLRPPSQQDSVGWATAYGAVSADRQTVVLTVQGTGEETVVLNDLHVRVVSSGPALDWNQYVMGNGCGGGVDTAAFDVALDLGTPLAMPVAGQRDFPYKVTESDPEVFHVRAHTSGHDVSWYLELEWSSGDRHGIMRVDDHGKPFRTSASKGDSSYVYPLGGNAWEEAAEED
ncbi:helix-turn-helix domain-containing protein [Streptomyces sp. NPDC093586]|uniref:helix-turn-helix domain-containing protein n=1 Tax=Streptomyces sp. NPDC093586 TaxID=3366042 RepID=UPI003809C306